MRVHRGAGIQQQMLLRGRVWHHQITAVMVVSHATATTRCGCYLPTSVTMCDDTEQQTWQLVCTGRLGVLGASVGLYIALEGLQTAEGQVTFIGGSILGR
jgi:hypothetical protein